jgi:hypothetical protein
MPPMSSQVDEFLLAIFDQVRYALAREHALLLSLTVNGQGLRLTIRSRWPAGTLRRSDSRSAYTVSQTELTSSRRGQVFPGRRRTNRGGRIVIHSCKAFAFSRKDRGE